LRYGAVLTNNLLRGDTFTIPALFSSQIICRYIADNKGLLNDEISDAQPKVDKVQKERFAN
jgi:hypothetical protein